MSQPAKPPAECMHSLTPHLVCADAIGAIDFYQRAFGAVELMKLVAPNGQLVHGGLRIGDSMLMLAEECPDWGSLGPKTLGGSPVVIHLNVPDVDAAIAKAEAAGATVTMPAADMFWGDRYGQVLDPYGHRWSIATHIKDMTPEEIHEGMLKAMPAGANC
jgi:PhnB protein